MKKKKRFLFEYTVRSKCTCTYRAYIRHIIEECSAFHPYVHESQYILCVIILLYPLGTSTIIIVGIYDFFFCICQEDSLGKKKKKKRTDVLVRQGYYGHWGLENKPQRNGTGGGSLPRTC